VNVSDTFSNSQREELHRTIWAIANDLRGAVDGWDFKQYVLGLLFYRYISENLRDYVNQYEREAGNVSFDYAQTEDLQAENLRDELVRTKGFFILPSELFHNMRKKAPHDPDLNITLGSVFRNVEASTKGTESEENFSGLFDELDVNSAKLGASVKERNQRLVRLLDSIGDLPLGRLKDNHIDAFGDAYEYLMGMYASSAGKSGGEFFTPQEVSELIARLTLVGKSSVNKVYDPACGSGGLLLKFAKILGAENVGQGFFGQEINLTINRLCRINMFLHDIDYSDFHIAYGDTLTDPQYESFEPFEAIVSNPPYSTRWLGADSPVLINDPRFAPAGVLAPKSKADLAFVMHCLSWLASSGTAAIVCFPGILYRGGAEQKIRQYLIDNNYIDCVIQLPDNLFYGTSIATAIMVLKKAKRDNATLFVDASKECVKVTRNNKLTAENIRNILTLYENRQNAAYLARLVPNAEIAGENYNLSVSTYVEKEDLSEAVDISKLNEEIRQVSARVNRLREEIDAIIAEIEG
jgi:type I restriction enzyme M protein